MSRQDAAPELVVQRWLNSEQAITLEALRGRVVLIYAFQMLCPGCVLHTIPQAKEVHDAFDPRQLVVLGLHTVFENHDVMTPRALEVFVHENRLRFPIGIDMPGDQMPQTMKAYEMQGTPTTVLIDALGRRRFQHLGHVPGMQLAAAITELNVEAARAG